MMKTSQEAALKKLEAALLTCKRSGLVFVGIDDKLIATAGDEAFRNDAASSSSCEAVLSRLRHGGDCRTVKHYGCYRDSGGA